MGWIKNNIIHLHNQRISNTDNVHTNDNFNIDEDDNSNTANRYSGILPIMLIMIKAKITQINRSQNKNIFFPAAG